MKHNTTRKRGKAHTVAIRTQRANGARRDFLADVHGKRDAEGVITAPNGIRWKL